MFCANVKANSWKIALILFLTSSPWAMEEDKESFEKGSSSTFPTSVLESQPVVQFCEADICNQGRMSDTVPLRYIESPYFISYRYSLMPLKIEEKRSFILLLMDDPQKTIRQFWVANLEEGYFEGEGGKKEESQGHMNQFVQKFVQKSKTRMDVCSAVILSGNEELLTQLKKSLENELPEKDIIAKKITQDQILLDKKSGLYYALEAKIISDHTLKELKGINQPSFFRFQILTDK